MTFNTIRNLGIGFLLLIVVSMSISFYFVLNKNSDMVNEIILVKNERVHKWYTLYQLVNDSRANFYEFIVTKDKSMANVIILLDKSFKVVDELKKSNNNDRELSYLKDISIEIKKFKQAVIAYNYEINYDYQGGSSANEIKNIAFKSANRISQLSMSIVEKIFVDINNDNTKIVNENNSQKSILIAFIYVAVISSLFVSIVMNWSLSNVLKKLLEVTNNIADGDLSKRIKVKSKDELGRLSESFNKMAENLETSTSELVRAKEFNDNVIQSMVDTLVVLTPDLKITKVNKSLCKLLNYKEADLNTQPVNKIFLDTEYDVFEQIDFKNICNDGCVRAIEKTYVTKEGRQVTVLFSASAIYGDDGGIHGIVCIAQDITLHKKREETLRLLKQSVETMQLGLTITDEDGKIIYVNNAEAKMHGYMVDELIGKEVRIFAPEELWDSESGASEYESNIRESINLRSDGTTFPVQLITDVVTDNQYKPVGLITLCEDITERKLLEEKLKQYNQELEDEVKKRTTELVETNEKLKDSQEQLIQSEKMVSLGILTAGIAHEINNPLGFVYSNINSMDKFLKKILAVVSSFEHFELPPDIKTEFEKQKELVNYNYVVNRMEQLVDRTKDGINRIKKIVMDLKSFSRLDKSELSITNFNESIDSTLSLMYHEYKDRIVINKEYGDIPDIECYSAKINQVLMNLLINACQAIEKSGEITIKTFEENEVVNIVIKDSGNGIPKEVQNRIFDPFFTTKPVGVGTGLGLSISYKIIKQHGGELGIESTNGQGTTATIKIPVHSSLKDII